MSIYEKGTLTAQVLVAQTLKLQKAFPALSAEFFEVLMERVRDLGFTNERLTHAINRTIDTCLYPTFPIAQILNYDVRYKLFTYLDYCNQINENKATDKDFTVIVRNGKKFFVKVADKEQFGIESEI